MLGDFRYVLPIQKGGGGGSHIERAHTVLPCLGGGGGGGQSSISVINVWSIILIIRCIKLIITALNANSNEGY